MRKTTSEKRLIMRQNYIKNLDDYYEAKQVQVHKPEPLTNTADQHLYDAIDYILHNLQRLSCCRFFSNIL